MKTYKVISAILCGCVLVGCSSADSSGSGGDDANGGSGNGSGDGGSSGRTDDGGSSNSDGGNVVAGLTASTASSLILAPGGTGTLAVTIVRAGGWDGDVVLGSTRLPAGITVDAATIAKGSTTTSMTFHASATASASGVASTIDAAGNGLVATATFSISIGHQSLDPSFGAAGIAFGGPDVILYDFVTRTNGKIVASSAVQSTVDYSTAPTLVQYADDGTIDTSFGASGQLVFANGNGEPQGLVLQNDGKIVLSFAVDPRTSGTARVGVTRANADGTLDTSFGSAGYAIYDFGACSSTSAPSTLALQDDGSIVVGATLACTSGSTAYTQGAVGRLTSSGAVDATFGTGGKIILPASTTSSTGIGHLLATSDALYLLETTYLDKTGQGYVTDGTIAKYDRNGSAIASSFATGGDYVSAGTFNDNDPTFSCLIAQSGKGLVWGMNGGGRFGRLTSAGLPDSTFGDASGGVGAVALTETFAGDWDDDPFTDLAIDNANGLFLAQTNIPKKAIELWAYSADGIRNMSFGGSSSRILVPLSSGGAVKRIRFGSDGRIVVLAAQNSSPGTGEAASALLRFFP